MTAFVLTIVAGLIVLAALIGVFAFFLLVQDLSGDEWT
jgi:hypothetical protein